MKKQLMILAIALLTFSQVGFAQVKGVGYTLSPIGDKVWWDKNSGFKDGYMLGGQFGFSFGEYVELRGLYMQGLNMQRDFSAYDIAPEALEDLDVSLTRWGGDLKLNLSRGALLPYVTIGTGVQSTRLGELDKNKQIYFSGGLGIMLSMGDRYTLGLQALRTSFRDNPVNTLLTPAERLAGGLNGSDFDYRSMNNWSARASLLFYLGGRRPNQMSDIDKAYMDTFSSGLKGLSMPIEPMIGKFNWADNLPYKSTTFAGVATGFDFGPLVGIRAYYLRSFDDKLFSEFDKLEVWGGEGKFKLASSGGLIPFLTAGGGRINVLNGYENPDFPIAATDTTGIEGRGFASGGGGFDLALSRHVKLSAFARAMLTSSHKNVVENISSPDELSTSWLYGASLNFIIGQKPDSPREIRDDDSYETQVRADLDKEKRNTRALRNQYQEKLNELEKEIDAAYKSGDSRKMTEKYEEQESLKRMISRLDDVMKKERDSNGNSDLVQMNPDEFRSLVEEIKQSQNRNEENIKQALEVQQLKNELQIERMTSRLRTLEESVKGRRPEGDDEMTRLRRELSELKNPKDEGNSEAEALRKEIRELRGEGSGQDNSQSEAEALRKEIRELRGKSEDNKQLTKDQQELESLRKEIQELKKSRNQERSGEVQTREQKELEELRKELREARSGVKSEAGDITDSVQTKGEKEVEELRKELRDLKKDVKQETDKKSADAKESLRESSKEVETREQKEIEDLKKEIRNLKKESDKTMKEEIRKDAQEDGLRDGVSFHTLPDGRMYRVGGYAYISEDQLAHRGEYNDTTRRFFGKLYYEGASAIVGLSLGGDPTFNIGLRQHYRFNRSNFFLMPETFFGFGSPASFGIFANAVYQFKFKETASIEPYAGLGLGLMQVGVSGDQKLKGATNIVFGANLFRMGGGRFYADWSARNFFKHNQLALGYRLPF